MYCVIAKARMGTILLILLGFLTVTHAAVSEKAYYRNFWHPLYHGQRLNYCSLDGKACGLAYAYYRSHRYVVPRFNHYRVDWCEDGTKHCGREAAYSFCRRMGYREVHQYRLEKHLGATQAIGNQKLCFGNGCSGFAFIDCYR